MTLHARLLQALAPWRAAPAWQVALSGGLDSTVLLHLLAQLAQREALPPLSAIHIHHGLQAAADAWPEHCRALCTQLGVPLRVEYVQVAVAASLEQAARNARYQAIAAQLAAGQVLLTAQHRDDQAETLMFRLLRGAGVQGLRAMPSARPLGAGQLVRPLLNCARSELLAYAQEHGFHWVEDPSNAQPHYSRNFLRQQVLPLLQQRWPQAAVSLARSAEHMAEAGQLLDELAAQDVQGIAAQPWPWLKLPGLAVAGLRELSAARQRNALRYWLRPFTAMPDTEHWAGWHSLLNAADDAAPIWRLAGGELRRSHAHVYWLSGDWLQPVRPVAITVQSNQTVGLPSNGRVQVVGQLPAGFWQVRYRQGGEHMTLPGRGQRDLKRLLNECQLPVFVRDRLPLLLCDGQLQGVANLAQMQASSDAGWQLQWQPPSDDQGLS
ncbi:tRNA lysidine(34) synthetase TilS [Pseudomonas sp. 5P_3.1_Bac2]|uniref:tRNA lysidine(34) synthetase TilS n=1 Tax=Pseudomonas sp. 5P_3.1_Bac2 TaxID=2971617 RepID=UPI0021CA0E3C|nr:tRNA lysidine(34) synthetase TilS [Pseudomonas sp. 5P_3.1_Bac2]MCU1715831.1 tRNA lysidine(34) synthetase TilS [Pseudomonas sp. 5P_3.1_Bac2]